MALAIACEIVSSDDLTIISMVTFGAEKANLHLTRVGIVPRKLPDKRSKWVVLSWGIDFGPVFSQGDMPK